MLRPLTLLAFAAAAAASDQIPLQEAPPSSSGLPRREPVFSSDTASYVFSSLHGLLRQWPNTFYSTGHTLVPATVPAHTLLYHARKDSGAVPELEWLAFDAEMSYGIMGGWGECYLHSYATTRDVGVVYLDGMSAVLGNSGTLDSQVAFLYGEVEDTPWGPGGPGRPPGRGRGGRRRGPGRGDQDEDESETVAQDDDKRGQFPQGEYERAEDLCAWAATLGAGVVEGFVRMNSGFELLWCNFTSPSLTPVSRLNVTVPIPPSTTTSVAPLAVQTPLEPPVFFRNRSPFAISAGWEWARSATWHYDAAPESRVEPDYCRFHSFYTLPSITSSTHGPRSSHRLLNLSRSDADAFRKDFTAQLLDEERRCSGLNWRRVAEGVMDRYGARLMELVHANDTFDARTIAHAAIVPFLDHSEETAKEKALARCRTDYTGRLSAELVSPSERVLKRAVEGVLERICDVVLDVYFRATEEGETDANLKGSSGDGERWWIEPVGELMEWLQWTMWTRCETVCAWDEICAIPLWPILGGWGRGQDIAPTCVNITAIQRGRGGGRPGRGGGRPPRDGPGYGHDHDEVGIEGQGDGGVRIEELLWARMGADW